MSIDANVLGSVTFLLPVITLFVGFLILSWDALKVAAAAWIVEVIVVLFAYPEASIIRSTLWANVDLWIGFAVLWTGFIFRQMYTNTGLLQRLVDVLDSLFKSSWGKALTLSGVVGGLIGAFNGFATYPVTIAGIKELGYKSWRAATGYLVFFSSSLAFVSLWIAAHIAEVGSHLPIHDLVPYMGAFSIPLVFLTAFGFAHILEINLREGHNLALLILTALGSITGIVIFTLIIPALYLLTLIGSSMFILLYLVAYGKIKKLEREKLTGISRAGIIRPFAPIIIGIALILLWRIEPIASIVAKAEFTLTLWSFRPVSINLIDNPGFFIFVIALVSHLFRINPKDPTKKPSNPVKDIVSGSKMGSKTLATLFLGGGLVGMMLTTGQITAVGQIMTHLGMLAYGGVLSAFSFISGIVFAQGIPADLMLSSMQVGIGTAVGLPLAFLVAIAATVVMGPANPLKPSLLSYAARVADAPEEDHPRMFRTALLWQIAALVIIIVEVSIAILFIF
jgi:lactate permease